MPDLDDLTPRPVPMWHRYKGVAVAYGVSMAAWGILSLGFTSALNNSKPFAAQAIYGGNVSTPLLTEQMPTATEATPKPLDPASAARLKEVAQKALRSEPMSIDAFAQLARSAQQAGDRSREELYLAEAFRRSFREPKVALQLLNSSLLKSDFGGAMRYMDAILREDTSLYPALLPVLMAFGDHPGARAALSETLKTRPPWRTLFIQDYGRSSQNAGALFEIHNALKGTTGALTLTEVRDYMFGLVKQNNAELAKKIWQDFFPPSNGASENYIYNGDFSAPVNNGPFNWAISLSDNATIKITPVPGEPANKALHIEFASRRGSFAHVEQTLTLAPGPYHFEGRVKTDDFQNIRGLVWRLYCGDRKSLNTQSLPIHNEASSWSSIDMNFYIEDTGCSSQTLVLAIDARIPAEQMASGAVWFDDLKIEKLQ